MVQIKREQPRWGIEMPVLSNPKYELFCRHLALGKSASEAYELAGYKPSRSNASVLRAKQNIADRLAEILQESEKTVLDQIEYTRDTLLSELEEARQLALKRGQPSAAVQASMGKARILGLIIDRREVGDPGAFDSKTDEELMEEARNRAAALGLLPPETQH
jgi:hypothetical protein